MKHIGSQSRETLKEAGYKVYDRFSSNELILQCDDTDCLEVWKSNDDYAGYVIEIDNIGHEYIHDLA